MLTSKILSFSLKPQLTVLEPYPGWHPSELITRMPPEIITILPAEPPNESNVCCVTVVCR